MSPGNLAKAIILLPFIHPGPRLPIVPVPMTPASIEIVLATYARSSSVTFGWTGIERTEAASASATGQVATPA